MSKFCEKCGTELADDVQFCENCGQPVVAASPADPATSKMPTFLQKLLSDKKMLGMAIGAVAAVIVVIILLVVLFGGSPYKKALNNYFDLMKGEISDVKALAPDSFWAEVKDEFDVTSGDVKDHLKDSYKVLAEALEEEYGKNIKIKWEVTSEEKLDKDDLGDIKDELKDKYGINKKEITEACELELHTETKGSEDEDENDAELTVVKIDGKWYIYNLIPSLFSTARGLSK